jgi:hypothetical protein
MGAFRMPRNAESKPWNAKRRYAKTWSWTRRVSRTTRTMYGYSSSTGCSGTRAAAPAPPAASRTPSTPRKAVHSNNNHLPGNGGVDSRRYWYEANGKLDCAIGAFKRVNDLCKALHERLGSLSTSAETVEVSVLGPDGEYVAVAKNRLCSEAIPAGVSLAPPTPGASPIRVTYHMQELLSRRGYRVDPFASRSTGYRETATVPATAKAVAVHAINDGIDAPTDTTTVPPTAVPSTPPPPSHHAPPVPASSTKRRSVILPPPTEREIAATAMKKCRRAAGMSRASPSAAAALSLEALHDVSDLEPDNGVRQLCQVVARMLNPGAVST